MSTGNGSIGDGWNDDGIFSRGDRRFHDHRWNPAVLVVVVVIVILDLINNAIDGIFMIRRQLVLENVRHRLILFFLLLSVVDSCQDCAGD